MQRLLPFVLPMLLIYPSKIVLNFFYFCIMPEKSIEISIVSFFTIQFETITIFGLFSNDELIKMAE